MHARFTQGPTRAQSPTGPDPHRAPLAPSGRHKGGPRMAQSPGEGAGENPVPDARAKGGLDSSVYVYAYIYIYIYLCLCTYIHKFVFDIHINIHKYT